MDSLPRCSRFPPDVGSHIPGADGGCLVGNHQVLSGTEGKFKLCEEKLM